MGLFYLRPVYCLHRKNTIHVMAHTSFSMKRSSDAMICLTPTLDHVKYFSGNPLPHLRAIFALLIDRRGQRFRGNRSANQKMTPEDIIGIQQKLGLSDGKMAQALGVTRQTWRNWRRGSKCPQFAQNALRWLMELRRLEPANDNLPARIRLLAVLASAVAVTAQLDLAA